jgi:hypothetical protein
MVEAMDGARKPVRKAAEDPRAREESPPSSRSQVPLSVTRQRRAIEPWKVLTKSASPEPLRLPVRAHDKVTPRKDYAGKIARGLYATLGVAVAAGASWRLHRASGWSVGPGLHTLLEGRPLLVASVAALGALALALVLMLMTLYARPRSIGYLVAAVAMVVVGLAFTFLALTTGSHDAVGMTGEAIALVGAALPFLPIGVGLRVVRNGWVAAKEREGLACESVLFAAGIATVLGLVGVELLLGAGLGRALHLS